MGIFDKLKRLFGAAPPPEAPEEPTPAAAAPPKKKARAEAAESDRELAPPTTKKKKKKKAAKAAAPPKKPRTKLDRRRARAKEDVAVEDEARALFARGDRAAALATLRKRTSLLARHAPGEALPCVCAACIDDGADKAEADGVAYVLGFAVAEHRALFYWMPAELSGNEKQVRSSMRDSIRVRLRASRKREPELESEPERVREVINPFTKQKQLVKSRAAQKRINPFTGEPVE